MRSWTLGVAATIAILSSGAIAADIRVLTVGGLQKPIQKIAADYEKDSGNKLVFTFTNPASLQKSLSEGAYDVVVVADAAVTELEKGGQLKAGSHVRIVRGPIGVSVREGTKFPDVSSPDALKATLLEARTIVYTDPSTPNGSGEKTKAILQQIGVWDAVVAKGKVMSLGPAKEAVAKGEFELGLFNASESEAPGCVLAGIVPASIGRYTDYDAGVMAKTGNAELAAGFLKYLAGSAAAKRWSDGHMTPVAGS